MYIFTLKTIVLNVNNRELKVCTQYTPKSLLSKPAFQWNFPVFHKHLGMWWVYNICQKRRRGRKLVFTLFDLVVCVINHNWPLTSFHIIHSGISMLALATWTNTGNAHGLNAFRQLSAVCTWFDTVINSVVDFWSLVRFADPLNNVTFCINKTVN